MHPAGRTALPAAPDKQDPKQLTLGKPGGDIMVETEFLYSGRIGFILGRRGKAYQPSGVDQLLGMEAQSTFQPPTLNSRSQQMLHQFATGGVDQHTMQRMCSLEYLQRYFYYVLRTKTINLAGGFYNADTDVPFKYRAASGPIVAATLNNVNGDQVIAAIANVAKATPPADKGKVEFSGVFAGDDGPFLRGKTLDSTLFPYRRNMQKASLGIGDRIAFEGLEAKLKEIGAMDWCPDGIVLSKLDSGGSDTLADDLIDARDGQLYNVTIGGPAITTSWTGDPTMEVLPLDKLFIVLVGDVWTGDINQKTQSKKVAGSPGAVPVADIDTIAAVWEEDEKSRTMVVDDTRKPPDQQKMVPNGATYTELFETHIDSAKDDRDVAGEFRTSTRGGTVEAAGPNTQVITNIRVERMTSSQMVSYSAYKPGSDKSRMGLKVGKFGGEYILGGWCIGTVIDSAAARAIPNGMSLIGSVKRARSAHAANLLVDIKWCSGDDLYRKYMNRPSLGEAGKPTEGLLRSRYDMRRRAYDDLNRPASKRP
jgi:hypothetical protein